MTNAGGPARALRLLGGGFVAGLLGGVVAGLGARLIMFTVRIINPAFNGSVTHNNVVNGQWTADGTLAIVVEALFLGLFGGWLYLLVRPVLVGPTTLRGLEFGALVLVVSGAAVLDGDYEYSRFVPSWQSVSAFGALFLVYGVVVATIADLLVPVAPRAASGPGRWLRLAGRVALAGAATFAAIGFVEGLRFRYGF